MDSAQRMVDLRLLDYISNIDRNLVCPICHCPFIEPLRLACDHTFCKQCLRKAVRSQDRDDKTCPSCRTPFTSIDALPVPRFMIHMIDDLVVKCPNHRAGCERQLKRSDIEHHFDIYCDYTPVVCAVADCPLMVLRKDRLRYEDRCPHSEKSCEHCATPVQERHMEEHLQKECKERMTTCQGCEEEVVLAELDKHLDSCPAVPVACPAAHIGCKHVSKRSEQEQHRDSCVLVTLLPTLDAMSRRMEDQSEALRIAEHRNKTLEADCARMQTLLTDAATPAANTSTAGQRLAEVSSAEASSALRDSASPPFDSTTHHLLCLYESLKEELDRLSGVVRDLEARSSMMIMNEVLRIKEEMAHTNAAVGAVRMQLQWLTSARLQGNLPHLAVGPSAPGMSSNDRGPAIPAQPVRRPSESSRQDTKL